MMRIDSTPTQDEMPPRCRRVALASPDPATGRSYRWQIALVDGREIPWAGFHTGPLKLTPNKIESICRFLLGHGSAEVQVWAERVLQPAVGERALWPALLLHSTTPDLNAFEGDLTAVAQGRQPGDYTTYKESRSVYLARPGDVAVGRTAPWRAAVAAKGTASVALPDVDHYYLSHALLHLAETHVRQPVAAIGSLVNLVRRDRRIVRLYAFELEMQIFLLWLARSAGVAELPVEANRPAVAAAWNRKSVLHPTVARAEALAAELTTERSPLEVLELESQQTALVRELGIRLPVVPGYTVDRRRHDRDDFLHQLVSAARLLCQRHGLTHGCLKATESGDGARITAGIELADVTTLEQLGRDAFVHGDDYLLEAQVDYRRPTIAGQTLPTALSAHVRGGRVAAGATIQYVEGTSWKGNVFLDDASHDLFRVPASHYRRLRAFMDDFTGHFAERDSGLVLAGIDFAVGTVGGAFGDELLLGVQDLNVSFTGAECLRAFLANATAASARSPEQQQPYGVTRIFRPRPTGDHRAFLAVTDGLRHGDVFCDTVAAIPGRWAMVGITGDDPADAMENMARLQGKLLEKELIEKPVDG